MTPRASSPFALRGLRSRHLLVALTCASLVTTSLPVDAVAAPTPPAPGQESSLAKQELERGNSLLKSGQTREALEAFQRSVAAQPSEPAQRQIAVCHQKLGDHARAVVALNELIANFASAMSASVLADTRKTLEEETAQTGVLRITISEPDATITLDGAVIGKTPFRELLRVNPGSHTLLASKSGFNDFTQTFEIRATAEQTIAGPIEPTKTTGKLIVRGKGAATTRVIVDGRDVGTLPFEGDVPAGQHTIEARGGGFKSEPVTITIERGKRAEVPLEIKSTRAHVQIKVATPDADISVDGTFVARDSWEGDLEPGNHTVEVHKDGFESYETSVAAAAGKLIDLNQISLKKKTAHTALDTEGSPRDEKRGLYLMLDIVGAFGTGDTKTDLIQPCPSQGFGPCSSAAPIGFGGRVNIGYSFGVIGIEGVGVGTYDSSTASANFGRDLTAAESPDHFGAARKEEYVLQRYGARLAFGVRATSPVAVARATGGIAIGAAGRLVNLTRTLTPIAPGPTRDKSDPVMSYSPAIMADLGVLLGPKTSTHFHLGIQMLVDFTPFVAPNQRGDTVALAGASGDLSTSRPKVNVIKGTEVFIGPVLGVQIGK